MEILAKDERLTCVIVFLEYVFMRFRHKKLLSTETLVEGMVRIKEYNL